MIGSTIIINGPIASPINKKTNNVGFYIICDLKQSLVNR